MTMEKLSNVVGGCKHIELFTIDPTDLEEPHVLPQRLIKIINYVLFLYLTAVRSVFRREKNLYSPKYLMFLIFFTYIINCRHLFTYG